MNKYLLGALIGLSTIGTTYASIVSRGFLDEQLTNYATTTALDLKANQSDLTNLSSKIGELPSEVPGNMWLTVNNLNDFTGIQLKPGDPLPQTISEQLELFLTGSDSVMENFAAMILILGGYIDEPATEENFVMGLQPLTQVYRSLRSIIGPVPKGYDSFGAALSAVKGIAEEAKQLAEQAIPNVLDEDSNGKYVLTAEKVGDVATYRWEIINRATNETTTNTTE